MVLAEERLGGGRRARLDEALDAGGDHVDDRGIAKCQDGDGDQHQGACQGELRRHPRAGAGCDAVANPATETAWELASLLRFAMQVVAQVLLEVVAHANASSDPVSSRSRRSAVFRRDFAVSTGILSARAVSSTLRSW